MRPSLTPVCSFEEIGPRDLLSAVQTNTKPLSKRVVRTPPLGLEFEAFLRWAAQDIENVTRIADPDGQTRFAVSTLMNARRSLSCLVDQYLFRDGFSFCNDLPRDANGKAGLLVKRGVFDAIAAGALGRAVDRRNRVEHCYERVDMPDVQDTLQLVRATIENTVAKSDPYWAPGFFGSFLGGHSVGPGGEKHSFQGWSGLLFVFARCDSPPWFGIVIPASETVATVRRVALRDLCCDQMLELLIALESQSVPGYNGYAEQTFRQQLVCVGLML